MRPATFVRIAIGSACVAFPAQVLAAVGGPDRDDRHTQTVARVLGGRLLAQSAADLALGPRTRRLEATVDLVHAASMLPIAMWWPAHRRTALVSAAAAAFTAALDLRPDLAEVGLPRGRGGSCPGAVSG